MLWKLVDSYLPPSTLVLHTVNQFSTLFACALFWIMLMEPFLCYLFRRYKPAPLELLCFLCQMGLVTPLFPFPRAFTNVCTKNVFYYFNITSMIILKTKGRCLLEMGNSFHFDMGIPVCKLKWRKIKIYILT